MSIFHTAVSVVSQTAVYEKNGEVYWIEVRKKVMKTYNTNKPTLYNVTLTYLQWSK